MHVIGVVEPQHVMDNPRAATHLMIVHLAPHIMSMKLHQNLAVLIMEMRLDHRPRPVSSLQHPSSISTHDHEQAGPSTIKAAPLTKQASISTTIDVVPLADP